MDIFLYKLMMEIIDYKSFFRNFTRILWSNAECADVALPKLS